MTKENPAALTENMAASAQSTTPQFLSPDLYVFLMTWVSFFLLLAVLHRYAWKPILAGLDRREESLRQSIDEADKIHQEYAQIETQKSKILRDAREEGKSIVTRSRKTAAGVAKVIEEKAKDEARITFENFERDIQIQKEKVQAELKKESADIAVALAGKIIRENLKDKDADQKFMDKIIKDLV